jgi:hypothetical protein
MDLQYDLYGPVVMLLMRATPLRGPMGGGWALEMETFLGHVKWHRAVRRVPFVAQYQVTTQINKHYY